MKKNILIIPNAEITLWNSSFTVEKNTGELALELTRMGHNVSFFGQFVSEKNNIHVFDLIKNGIGVYGLKRQNNKIINYLFLYLFSIRQIIKSDFVYIFYPSSFKYIAFLCKIFRRKYGLYIRGMEDLDSKSSKKIIANADMVLSVADYFSDFSKKINKNLKVKTIRPMIKLDMSDIVLDRSYLRKDYYKFLYLGRMTNDKGIIELIYASEILKKMNISFELVLVGDGEYINELKLLVENLDLFDVVSFENSTFDKEKIKNYFLEADMYVLPTYHEGFPRTLYEAMIYGTPIATTFVGGISSVMKADVNCRELLPKSVESIVDVMKKTIVNYTDLEEIAKEGTKTVQNILENRKYSHAEDLNYLIKELYKYEKYI